MPKTKSVTKETKAEYEAKERTDDNYQSPNTRKHQFAPEFRAAIRRKDASAVRDMAKGAGADRNREALRPLCDFLTSPSDRWKIRRRRKTEWREARAASAWALGQICDPAAHGTLATVMICDPDTLVRQAAAEAIDRAGADAIPVMVATLRTENDWRLEGMTELIHRLGGAAGLSEAARRNAGMALIDVLYENFPIAPRRWSQPAREFGRFVAFVITIVLTIGWVINEWYWPMAMFCGWIVGQIAGLGARILALLFTGVQNPVECSELYAAAARSLVRLGDKRAIPGMLQLAFLTPLGKTWRHARQVLECLLPRLERSDAGLFSTADIEIMDNAIGQPLEPKLSLGLLRALEFVGNHHSIRPVERLAQRSGHKAVALEAARVAELLRAKEERKKMSKHLLRGSQAPGAEPSEMLRPAVLQQEQRPELLLRPVHETTDPTGTEARSSVNMHLSAQARQEPRAPTMQPFEVNTSEL